MTDLTIMTLHSFLILKMISYFIAPSNPRVKVYNEYKSMEIENQIRFQLQDQFEIIKLLGKGSFGNVYECQDKNDLQIYAIKIISKINVKRAKIETLKEEAKLLKSLTHKNIVKIYEYGEFQSCIYIKMQLAKGGTLQAFIERKKREQNYFNDDQAASVIGQIMRGLSYIHSLNIIHRDIKPDNILIINQENLDSIKIADFGLSTKLDFHYPKSAIAKCGTLLFMAPQILCKYTYTKAIDIWSTAIIMYIMLTRLHPIWNQKMSTDDYTLTVSKIIVLPALKNNQLGQDFLSRISKVDPNERYTAQQCLKHPWITRKFHDQIPLSVHESYASFTTGNEIVQMVKFFIGIKAYLNVKEEIPKGYLSKVKKHESQMLSEIHPKQMHAASIKLKKLKSLNLEKESLINSLNSFQNQKEEVKKNQASRSRMISESDTENPTINKLNQIFNTLFDKKITSKSKITYRQKEAAKEIVQSSPNIGSFKSRIQFQIEKTVQECLESSKFKSKRILPVKASPSKQNQANSDQRVDMTQVNKPSFLRKSKPKKKNHQIFRQELK